MAVVSPTFSSITGVTGGIDAIIVTWGPMGDSDTAGAVQLPDRIDRSVQVIGTFGGATITMQGSNDGTNFNTVNDAFGAALTLAAAAIKQVTEAALWIRPSTASGSGSSLTIIMCARRTVR